ncbi:ATP-binding cassette domain-containing protein [Nonomuraea recticatena]|uniref:ATP-binding cassette domain-containing protein n=1 Tax=Nonomuraea recticatena TaxID=46178 RepID=UPI00360E7CDD
MHAVELEGVSVQVVGRALLAGIDWRVAYGQHWVILGPNGAGKTTLLSLAAAVRHPTEGVATVLGRRLGRVDLRELRRDIGLVAASQRLVDESLLEEEGATAHTVVLTGHTGTSAPLWDRYGQAEHDRAHALLADMGCKDLADRLFRVCSQGRGPGSGWRGRSWPSPRSCCSTSPSPASTFPRARTSSPPSRTWRSAKG